MAFKITPVNDYDAAYPRRRPRIPTAPAAPRFSLWRWLVTLVMGLFISLYTAACGDGDTDTNSDGDVTEETDVIIDGDLDDDYNPYLGTSDTYDDDDGWDMTEGDYHPIDSDPEPEWDEPMGMDAPMEYEEEETGIDDIDTWDMTDGDYHPTDPDPEMGPEEETDLTDIDTWEQPDKPGPESEEPDSIEDEAEFEFEDELDGLTGLVDPNAVVKGR